MKAATVLLAIAAVSALASLLLWGVHGYHAGFLWLNAALQALPPWAWQNLTFMGDSLFALMVLALLAYRYPEVFWPGVVSALLATLVSHGIKEIMLCPRPLAVYDLKQVHLIGPFYTKKSFPSGHSTTIFVLLSVWLACFRRPWQAGLGVLLAGLIALSRVAVAAHFPIDVLGGAAIGAGSGVIGSSWAARYPIRSHGQSWWGCLGLLWLTALWGLTHAPIYPDSWPLQKLVCGAVFVLWPWAAWRFYRVG